MSDLYDRMQDNRIKGICFFDLDGTLLYNRTNEVPESAQRALRLLRGNGYKNVISTGRDMDTHYSRAYLDIIRPDAIIHQNGSKITVGDELLFRHTVDRGLLREIYEYCREMGFCIGTCVGREDFFLYPEKKDQADRAYNPFIRRNYVPFEQLFERNIEVTALAFAGDIPHDKPLIEARFPNLRLLPYNSNKGADIVESGFSKAEGMKRLCAYYNVPLTWTYAFGDSQNDIAILECAGVGIAMGNAEETAKEAADYVTDDIMRDGIYRACLHFGLIEPSVDALHTQESCTDAVS